MIWRWCMSKKLVCTASMEALKTKDPEMDDLNVSVMLRADVPKEVLVAVAANVLNSFMRSGIELSDIVAAMFDARIVRTTHTSSDALNEAMDDLSTVVSDMVATERDATIWDEDPRFN